MDGVNSYKCLCPRGYSGPDCGIGTDLSPFMRFLISSFIHGGRSVLGSYKIFDLNLTDIFDCDPLPCQNGGICIDGVDSYFCQCPKRYVGVNCEESKH